jgi:hypothetical protein
MPDSAEMPSGIATREFPVKRKELLGGAISRQHGNENAVTTHR